MINVAGVILARLDSTRLPGKVLIQVQGVPLIGYVIARAKHIPGLSALVLATTKRAVDDPLVEYALSQDILVYRGDLSNVAQRVLNCVRGLGCDYFVRLNGDAPFLDPSLIAQGIARCPADLVTNLIGHTFPYGVAVEIVRSSAFERAYARMASPDEHEHVTRYLYTHADEFEIQAMTSPFPGFSQARMVVDTEADLEKFERVISQLGREGLTASYQQVALRYLR